MKNKKGIVCILSIAALVVACLIITFVHMTRNRNNYDDYAQMEKPVDIKDEERLMFYENNYLEQLVSKKDELIMAGVPESFFNEPFISFTTEEGFTTFITREDGSIIMIIVNIEDGEIVHVSVTETG